MKEGPILAIAGVVTMSLVALCFARIRAASSVNATHETPPELLSVSRGDLLDGAHLLKGDLSKAPILVEFFDYECPPCRAFAAHEQESVGPSFNKVSLAVHFFPLAMHPFAKPAALLAEAAEQKGRFAQLHNDLMKTSFNLSVSGLSAVGKAVGVNLGNALSDKEASKALVREVAIADRLKLNSTPSFFLCDSDGKVWKLASPQQASQLVH